MEKLNIATKVTGDKFYADECNEIVKKINEIAGFQHDSILQYKAIKSLSELPTNPTNYEKSTAYLYGKKIYVFVGEGGEVENDKYKAYDFKGDQGNSGYSGKIGELEVVNNLTQGGETAALSAEMGKTLKENADETSMAIKDLKTDLSTISLNNVLTKSTRKWTYKGVRASGDDASYIIAQTDNSFTFKTNNGWTWVFDNGSYDMSQVADDENIKLEFDIRKNSNNAAALMYFRVILGKSTNSSDGLQYIIGQTEVASNGWQHITINFKKNDTNKTWTNAKIWYSVVGKTASNDTMTEAIVDIKDITYTITKNDADFNTIGGKTALDLMHSVDDNLSTAKSTFNSIDKELHLVTKTITIEGILNKFIQKGQSNEIYVNKGTKVKLKIPKNMWPYSNYNGEWALLTYGYQDKDGEVHDIYRYVVKDVGTIPLGGELILNVPNENVNDRVKVYVFIRCNEFNSVNFEFEYTGYNFEEINEEIDALKTSNIDDFEIKDDVLATMTSPKIVPTSGITILKQDQNELVFAVNGGNNLSNWIKWNQYFNFNDYPNKKVVIEFDAEFDETNEATISSFYVLCNGNGTLLQLSPYVQDGEHIKIEIIPNPKLNSMNRNIEVWFRLFPKNKKEVWKIRNLIMYRVDSITNIISKLNNEIKILNSKVNA